MSRENPVKRYTISELLKEKEFNEFLDGIMGCSEVARITLSDHLIESGWDSCDVDMNVEIDGGRASEKLGIHLAKYPKVHTFWSINKQTGELEMSGHHGSNFTVIAGKYYLEIAYGWRPWTVPYLVLRERGIHKKKWLP